MKNLVSTELLDGISTTMLEDSLVHIISDNALFLVTTVENAFNYPDLEFHIVPQEAIEDYELTERMFQKQH